MTRARNTNRYNRYHHHHSRRYGQGGSNPKARIQRNRRPNSAFVDPVTLHPLNERTLRGARATNPPRAEMVKEDTTPHNVHRATTLFLLRMRARTVRAQYERCWDVLNDHRPRPFTWKSPEQGDSDGENEQRLREYIESHVIQIQRLRSRIECNEDAKYRMARANRSGGARHRMWEARNEAIMNELLWRDERATSTSARAVKVSGARAHSDDTTVASVPTSLQQYPLQYAVDNQRIANEQEMDDLGLKKPTKKERIKASIVNAIDKGDFSGARKLQDQLEGMNEHERRVRSAKKARAKVIARCRANMNARTRSPDPNSDNEGGASAAT